MPRIHATASRSIAAPPELVYAILADYMEAHPGILPSPPFVDYRVEKGGTGAGTIVRFGMKSFGRTQTFRVEITEPQPGRVLTETDTESGARTTFTVNPEGVDGTRVTITTEWSSPAPRGWIERMLAPPFLRRLYEKELGSLAQRAGTST